jgi:regulatory protein
VPVLTDIRVPRRGSRLRQLLLDGERWRAVSSAALARLELHVGDELDPQEVETALAEIEPGCAREQALRLLTFKERSVAGLTSRLEEEGYPTVVARGVVERLTRVGLVDDDRFARALARTLTQVRGIGRSRALRELLTAGIEPELAQTAVDEALPSEDEALAARRLADAAAKRPGATVDKVAGRLLRRGYRAAVALSAARAAVECAGRDGADCDTDHWDDIDGDLGQP